MKPSALSVHTKTFDEVTYYATAWPALKALEMGARLGELAGDAALALLVKAFATKDAKAPPEAPDVGVAGAFLLNSIGKNGKAGDIELLKECFRYVQAQPLRIGDTLVPEPRPLIDHFDFHFTGRPLHFFAVLFWVLQVSFFQPGGERS